MFNGFLIPNQKGSKLYKWDRVFKNGPSKISVKQPLKNFTWTVLENFVPSHEQNKTDIYNNPVITENYMFARKLRKNRKNRLSLMHFFVFCSLSRSASDKFLWCNSRGIESSKQIYFNEKCVYNWNYQIFSVISQLFKR